MVGNQFKGNFSREVEPEMVTSLELGACQEQCLCSKYTQMPKGEM